MRHTWIVAVSLGMALPALAGDTPDTASVRGEIVATRLSPATAREQNCLEVQVRQQDRERVWLRLGPADDMAGKFREGDRIRARVMSGVSADATMVRDVRNESNGARMRLRNARGELLRDRNRDRTHRPAAASGARGASRGGKR